VNQIVELDVHGQRFTHPGGDRRDKREVIQNEFIAADEIFATGWFCCGRSHFGLFLAALFASRTQALGHPESQPENGKNGRASGPYSSGLKYLRFRSLWRTSRNTVSAEKWKSLGHMGEKTRLLLRIGTNIGKRVPERIESQQSRR
jgi:hypothetical protein